MGIKVKNKFSQLIRKELEKMLVNRRGRIFPSSVSGNDKLCDKLRKSVKGATEREREKGSHLLLFYPVQISFESRKGVNRNYSGSMHHGNNLNLEPSARKILRGSSPG